MPSETGWAAAARAAGSAVPSPFSQCSQCLEPAVDGKLCLQFWLLSGWRVDDFFQKIICIDIWLLVWCPGKIFPAVS